MLCEGRADARALYWLARPPRAFTCDRDSSADELTWAGPAPAMVDVWACGPVEIPDLIPAFHTGTPG